MVRLLTKSVDVQAAMVELAAGRTPSGAFTELLPAAREHGLGSLLAFRFGSSDPEAAAYLRQAAIREMRISALQARLLKELAAVGVQAWPYKGPSLRALLNSPAPRESRDLDILVPQDQIDLAYETLLIGRSAYGPGPTVRREGLWHHASILDPDTQIPIELHWALADPRWRFEPETLLWQDIEVAGRPSPDLLYSILAHHAIKHAALRLQWLNDLVELARSPDWSLSSTLEVADKCGSRLAVDVTLVLLDRFLGVSVPPYKASVRAGRIARLCQWGIRRSLNHVTGRKHMLAVHFLLAPDKQELVKSILKGRRVKQLEKCG